MDYPHKYILWLNYNPSSSINPSQYNVTCKFPLIYLWMYVGCVSPVVYDENHNEVGADHSQGQAEHEQRLNHLAESSAQQEGGATWVAGVRAARVSYGRRYQPGPFRVHYCLTIVIKSAEI